MKPNRIEPDDAATEQEQPSALYARLEPLRQPFLDRARENAQYTIPALMPPEGTDGSTRLPTPFQSIGSHGVNTLSTKLVKTLLPENGPMFRMSVSDKVVEELSGDPNLRADVEKKLNEIERSVTDEIEGLSIRAALTEALKQLIVCGNVLLYLPKSGGLKIFKLDRYVVQRDFEGNVLRIIIKEMVAREVLPTEVREMIKESSDLPSDDTDRDAEKNIDVYTVFEREGDRIKTYQSIKGKIIPKSRGSWPVDKSPVMPLRWTYLSDEDYGRAYIDEYIGDLTGVEALSKAIREGSAAAAKMNPMVNPTGLTRAQDIARAKNLEVIAGRKDDVTMLQFDKQADFAVAQKVLQDLISRLTHAFMMNRSVQRDAERVTAEEIRALVSDIDDVLGGIYSLLAQDLQRPLVIRVMDRMERQKKIPRVSDLKDPSGKPLASPKVITGVEALGRGHDYNKYMTAIRDVVVPFKEELRGELNVKDLVSRVFTSLSIDQDGIWKTEEQKLADKQQVAEMQQGQMTQQMLMDAVKGGAGPVAKVAAEGMAQQVQGEGAQ